DDRSAADGYGAQRAHVGPSRVLGRSLERASKCRALTVARQLTSSECKQSRRGRVSSFGQLLGQRGAPGGELQPQGDGGGVPARTAAAAILVAPIVDGVGRA